MLGMNYKSISYAAGINFEVCRIYSKVFRTLLKSFIGYSWRQREEPG